MHACTRGRRARVRRSAAIDARETAPAKKGCQAGIVERPSERHGSAVADAAVSLSRIAQGTAADNEREPRDVDSLWKQSGDAECRDPCLPRDLHKKREGEASGDAPRISRFQSHDAIPRRPCQKTAIETGNGEMDDPDAALDLVPSLRSVVSEPFHARLGDRGDFWGTKSRRPRWHCPKDTMASVRSFRRDAREVNNNGASAKTRCVCFLRTMLLAKFWTPRTLFIRTSSRSWRRIVSMINGGG